MAGLLDPRQGDGTWVESRPTKWQQTLGILNEYNPIDAFWRLYDSDMAKGGPVTDSNIEDAMTVTGMVTGGSALAPKPRNALNMGIRAYHGSPHDFDKFDMSKIGTGEGAQAYGHGLYFADSEGIARHYRDALSSNKFRYENVQPDDEAFKKFANQLADVENKQKNLSDPEGFISLDSNYSDLKSLQAEKDKIRNMMIMDTVNRNPHLQYGRMYEVNIAADPNTFLDWDKPLSEQPKAVRQALAKFDPEMYSPEGADYDPTELGQIAYQRMFHDTRKKIGPNQGAKTYQAEISKNLNQAGIPGIKYLDAGSRGAGDGTRNYVVFDDNLINILRKYGIAGLLGTSAAGNAMLDQPQEVQ